MRGASGGSVPGLANPVLRPGRWSDLRIRVLSALVLLPVALVCAWLGGPAFWALIVVAGVGLALELLTVTPGPGHQGDRPLLVSLGLLYVAIAGIALISLRADPLVGRANLLVLMMLVWASDVGAYTVGRTLGGPRLAPAISPGKTISGAFGGLLAAVAVGLGAALALSHPPHLLRAALLAALLGIIAQAGDLGESWVKRRFGVKDSGSLIPGHGGLFDRLDALLAAAPAAALLAFCAGRGVAWWG